MDIWHIGFIVQVVCVIVNGCFILLNYRNYRKYQHKVYVALVAFHVFMLLFCGFWAVVDAAHIS